MPAKNEKTNHVEAEQTFGNYSWLKPALVLGGIGVSIYGLFWMLPFLLETIQAVFLYLMFFGMLS